MPEVKNTFFRPIQTAGASDGLRLSPIHIT